MMQLAQQPCCSCQHCHSQNSGKKYNFTEKATLVYCDHILKGPSSLWWLLNQNHLLLLSCSVNMIKNAWSRSDHIKHCIKNLAYKKSKQQKPNFFLLLQNAECLKKWGFCNFSLFPLFLYNNWSKTIIVLFKLGFQLIIVCLAYGLRANSIKKPLF